jgi:hypothetical protein
LGIANVKENAVFIIARFSDDKREKTPGTAIVVPGMGH